MRKRIYRSTSDKVIGGVCGGLGEYFNTDPTWIRILFVVTVFAHGIGLLAYLIAWLVISKQPESIVGTAANGPAGGPESSRPPTDDQAASTTRGAGFLPGVILVVLGMIFLLDEMFYWFDFDFVWPLVLIGIGVILIYRAVSPTERPNGAAALANNDVGVQNGSR